MPSYFYIDANGQKQGPINDLQLKTLAEKGAITPTTPMETDDGHQGFAGQIPNLFATTSSLPVPVKSKLFCTNCGNSISEQTVACMSCGAKPTGHRKFCRQCAAVLGPEQVVCVKCGTEVRGGGGAIAGTKNKIVAGLLAIFFGFLGVHKFYMGSWGWGLIFLCGYLFFLAPLASVISLVSLGLLFPLSILLLMTPGICSLVEGIIYLVMSDEAFAAKYSSVTQRPFRW